jgi:hypothetical protein
MNAQGDNLFAAATATSGKASTGIQSRNPNVGAAGTNRVPTIDVWVGIDPCVWQLMAQIIPVELNMFKYDKRRIYNDLLRFLVGEKRAALDRQMLPRSVISPAIT